MRLLPALSRMVAICSPKTTDVIMLNIPSNTAPPLSYGDQMDYSGDVGSTLFLNSVGWSRNWAILHISVLRQVSAGVRSFFLFDWFDLIGGVDTLSRAAMNIQKKFRTAEHVGGKFSWNTQQAARQSLWIEDLASHYVAHALIGVLYAISGRVFFRYFWISM